MLNHINFTNLYLLEFFVEKASFENVDSFLGEYFGKKIKLCLSFQFLQYLPMKVCQEVFLVQNYSTLVLKQGKSCLFASKDINRRNSREFEVKIFVSQVDLEVEGCAEAKVIGETVVEVGREFLKGNGIRGDFPLKSESGERFGSLSICLSLTSWGEKIVTRFQAGGQNGNFMFKGMEMDQANKETESTVSSMHEEEQNSRTNLGEASNNTVEQMLGTDEFDPQNLEYTNEESSFEDSDSFTDSEENAEDEASQLEAKNYKEIEFSINNHVLRLKVMRDEDGRIVYDNGDGQSEDEKRHSISSTAIVDESTARKSEQEPVQEPGVVQIKGDRILLDVPEKETNSTPGFESPVYRFKSGKEMDANVITFSQSCDTQMEFGKADLQQETFLIVVKNNRHDSKAKNSNRLDLELRTRKLPEPKPEADEKNTQYDINDLPSGGKSKKGKGKGKGKGKNDKKKKKGKK